MFCNKGIWNETVPGIKIDKEGISNYAKIQEALMHDFPRGIEGKNQWKNIVKKVISCSKKKNYNCIIGVSGGTDSSYLLHIAKKYGLNPLAVNLDNGWNSDIAVKNIKKVTSALKIDLETYVINYEEIKDLLRSYIRAGLPWIDNPTDMAIQSILYKIAKREGIKYILVGNDFRSEGKQPTEWTYSDQRQLKFIHKKFGETKLKTYPIISMPYLLYLGYFKGIKMLPPFNYLEYDKQSAQEFLIKEYSWQYYGEHHHENLFTKWAIGYWMYEKFNIDKRIITYSAQILSDKITRNEALDIIKNKPYDENLIKEDTNYVLKKLSISNEEFVKIWNSKNKSFLDYPSYYRILRKFIKIILPIIKHIVPVKPKIFYEIEQRK